MRSLERRLQLGLVLSLVLLIGLFWGVGSQAVNKLTEDYVLSRLEHDAESLLSALVIEPGQVKVRWRRLNQVYTQPFSGHYYTLLFEDGKSITSRSLWDQSLTFDALKPGESQHLQTDGPSEQRLLLWVKGFQKSDKRFTLMVAEDLTTIQAQRDIFIRDLAFLMLGGFLLLLFVQSIVIRRSFKRLESVREDIHRLERGETGKLSEDVPTEILPLVQELNHLLELLSQRLERSRNALGNLAHALKGPLSLLHQKLDRDAPMTDSDHTQARAQTERIHQLMERELKRARLAGSGLSSQRFEAAKELPDLVGLLRQLHHSRGLDIDYKLIGSANSLGDREDMLELLGNLLDNACKWATSRVLITVSGGQRVAITVEDDGEGLSNADIERLTQRGVRLDESVEGHGLGLAITKDIVKLYGGDIAFQRSEALGGLRVEVSFSTDDLINQI